LPATIQTGMTNSKSRPHCGGGGGGGDGVVESATQSASSPQNFEVVWMALSVECNLRVPSIDIGPALKRYQRDPNDLVERSSPI